MVGDVVVVLSEVMLAEELVTEGIVGMEIGEVVHPLAKIPRVMLGQREEIILIEHSLQIVDGAEQEQLKKLVLLPDIAIA